MHLCLRQNDKVYLKQPRRKQPEAEKKKKKKQEYVLNILLVCTLGIGPYSLLLT